MSTTCSEECCSFKASNLLCICSFADNLGNTLTVYSRFNLGNFNLWKIITSARFSWYLRTDILKSPSVYWRRLTHSLYLELEKYMHDTKKHLVPLVKYSSTSSLLKRVKSGFMRSTSINYFRPYHKHTMLYLWGSYHNVWLSPVAW